MNRIEYMKPSMMVVKIQTANQLLNVSDEYELHNEVSSKASYSRGCNWDDEE